MMMREIVDKMCPIYIYAHVDSMEFDYESYSYGVQGYFIKPNSYGEMKSMLHTMITYWGESQQSEFDYYLNWILFS
jgi:hypothetical protein